MTEELKAYLLDMETRLFRTGWEQTREILLFIAHANGKKKFEKKDILKLPWDDEDGNEES